MAKTKMLRTLFSITMVAVLVFTSGCTAKTQSGTGNTQSGVAKETQKPIKIGFSGAMTGQFIEYGEASKRAYLVAIKQWNDKGGINGRKIELITKDDQFDANKGQINVKELLEVDKVDAIMIAPGSAVAMATLPLMEARNIPAVNALTSTPLVVYPNGEDKPPRKNVFNVAVLRNVEIAHSADYVGQHFKKIGLLYESTVNGTGSADMQAKRFKEKFGLDVVGREKYDQKDPSMTAQLMRLQKAGAEVIMFTGIGADAANIRKEMNRLGFNVPFIGTLGLLAKSYSDLAGKFAEGTIFSGYGVFDGNPPKNPVAKKFMEDYLKMWGHDRYYGEGEWPTSFFQPVVNYDAMNVLLEGIRLAGSTDSNAIVNALNNLKDYQGAINKYTFTPEKHSAINPDDVGLYTYKLNPDGKTLKIVPYDSK